MLSTLSSPLAFAPAMAPTMAPTRAMPVMQTKEELATALNPAIGYCAPSPLQPQMQTYGSTSMPMQ
jgi:hypothetical protein